MKREVKLLLAKSLDSLTLAMELFNRPVETGRSCTVLILLDHSFEMLLKAALVHRGGSIRDSAAANTITQKTCINRACTSGTLKCIDEEQAAILRSINSLRDIAQHHLLEISEHLLYLQAISAVTLFRDLLASVFGENLADYLPQRVLPVANMPPVDLVAIFSNEVEAVRQLLRPGRRKQADAMARMQTLLVVDNALAGEENPPAERQLRRLIASVRADKALNQLFPSVSSIETTLSGAGPTIELRMTKRSGLPVHYSTEDTASLPLAARKVTELDIYCLGLDQVAGNLGVSRYDALALIYYLRIQDDSELFKPLNVYRKPTNRYSHAAVARIRAALANPDMLENARTANKRSSRNRKGRK